MKLLVSGWMARLLLKEKKENKKVGKSGSLPALVSCYCVVVRSCPS